MEIHNVSTVTVQCFRPVIFDRNSCNSMVVVVADLNFKCVLFFMSSNL